MIEIDAACRYRFTYQRSGWLTAKNTSHEYRLDIDFWRNECQLYEDTQLDPMLTGKFRLLTFSNEGAKGIIETPTGEQYSIVIYDGCMLHVGRVRQAPTMDKPIYRSGD